MGRNAEQRSKFSQLIISISLFLSLSGDEVRGNGLAFETPDPASANQLLCSNGSPGRANPTPFTASGPAQMVGVSGDRTVKITVFNGPPDGGLSNSISLKVIAKWLADEQK